MIFMTGVIKYEERTRSLRLASLENLKKSFMKLPEPSTTLDEVAAASRSGDGDGDTDMNMCSADIKKAHDESHHFFQIFKGLIVDITPSSSEVTESRGFFLNQDPFRAYIVISLELVWLYERFYTKIMGARSICGVLIRGMAFNSAIVALVLFAIRKKEDFISVDVRITYALLVGVIMTNTTSYIQVAPPRGPRRVEVYAGLQSCIDGCACGWLICCVVLSTAISLGCCLGFGHVYIRQWSETMGAFNLLTYCFEDCRPRKGHKVGEYWRIIFDFVTNKTGISEALAEMRYSTRAKFDRELWTSIFGELREKAMYAVDSERVKEIYEARGEWALRNHDFPGIVDYVKNFDYDNSLLIWHMATEICYNVDNHSSGNSDREFSKMLSDYMLYLLIKQPKMMSIIAGKGYLRYSDTREDLKYLEQEFRAESMEELCNKIVREDITSDLEPTLMQRDGSKSVLFDSRNLARLLMQNNMKWEITLKVWVELLSYAAGHIQGESHARSLSEGGELTTFVWLLMAHFGIVPHFPRD